MDVTNAVLPKPEQFQKLMAEKDTTPIVMLNLLRFRKNAAYEDGHDADISGREAYMRYAEKMIPIVQAGGGRVVYEGQIKGLVIGAVGDMWDACALVEYPSAIGFTKIASSPEVAEIAVHRAAGLDGQLLIQMKTGEAIL